MSIEVEKYKISLNNHDQELLMKGLFGQHASRDGILKRLENDWNIELGETRGNIGLIANPIFKKDTKKSTEKKKKKKKKRTSSTLKK